MEAIAFCPAHVTGFFKAHLNEKGSSEEFGSTGAGFSITEGVTTRVITSKKIADSKIQNPMKIQNLEFQV